MGVLPVTPGDAAPGEWEGPTPGFPINFLRLLLPLVAAVAARREGPGASAGGERIERAKQETGEQKNEAVCVNTPVILPG